MSLQIFLSIAYLVVLVLVVAIEILLTWELRQVRRELKDLRSGMRDTTVAVVVMQLLALAVSKLAKLKEW